MSGGRWVRAAGASELEAADGLLGVIVEGQALALYLVEGEVFATADLCTHGAARLSDGYLEDHLIECPLHQGTFDVRDGRAASAPCVEAVRAFPARREGDEILVEMAG